jgi:hypothetical protein
VRHRSAACASPEVHLRLVLLFPQAPPPSLSPRSYPLAHPRRPPRIERPTRGRVRQQRQQVSLIDCLEPLPILDVFCCRGRKRSGWTARPSVRLRLLPLTRRQSPPRTRSQGARERMACHVTGLSSRSSCCHCAAHSQGVGGGAGGHPAGSRCGCGSGGGCKSEVTTQGTCQSAQKKGTRISGSVSGGGGHPPGAATARRRRGSTAALRRRCLTSRRPRPSVSQAPRASAPSYRRT